MQHPGPQLRLLLVRHGESKANAQHRMQGLLDSPLSHLGVRQAEAIAERIAAGGRPHAIYSSPLRRALHTARAIGRRTGIEPVVLSDLVEVNIGAAMGLTWAQFEARYPDAAHAIQDGAPNARWPEGESRQELAERAARVMDDIVARHRSGTVVVVSHGGTLRWAVAHLMRGTEAGHPRHRFENCAVTEVVISAGGRLMACANDASHLQHIEADEAHTA